MKKFRRFKVEEEKLEDQVNELIEAGYHVSLEEDELSGLYDYFTERVAADKVPSLVRRLSRTGWKEIGLDEAEPDTISSEPRTLVTAWKRTKIEFVLVAVPREEAA